MVGSKQVEQMMERMKIGVAALAAIAAAAGDIMDSIAALTGFRDVKLGLVRDDAPDPVREEAVRSIRDTIRLQHALTGRPVVVVPVLISKGWVSTHKLPKDLEDLPIAYDAEGLLPHPVVAHWIERRVREAVGGSVAAAARQ